MAPLSVLIGEDIGPEHLARLRREFPQVDFRFCLAAVAFTAAAPMRRRRSRSTTGEGDSSTTF